MEHAGRLLGVFAQRIEKRCLVTLTDAPHDRTVELDVVLLAEEDAPEGLAHACGDLLDVDVGHQIQVEFRPKLGDLLTEQRATLRFRHLLDGLVHAVQEAAQRVVVVNRAERKTMADHDGLQVEVDQRRDQGVFKTRYHHDVKHEVVVGASLVLHASAQGVLFTGRHLVDDQYFEIRAGQLGLPLGVGLDL